MFKRLSIFFALAGSGIGGLSYDVYQKATIHSPDTYSYTARLPIKENLDKKDLDKTMDELAALYKKKSSSYEIKFSKSEDNKYIFLDMEGASEIKNLDKAWFDFFKLNHFTIDKYGYDFATDTSQSAPKLFQLVDWKDVDMTSMQLVSDNNAKFNRKKITVKIKPKHIIEKVHFESLKGGTGAHDIPEGKRDTVNNYWFMWLDKDLLLIKLNYLLQTWAFNQPEIHQKPDVIEVMGAANNPTEESKERKKIIEKNFADLKSDDNNPTPEMQFLENYKELFLTDKGVVNWQDVEGLVTTTKLPLASGDINKIYNKFLQSNKDLKIFDHHLIRTITWNGVADHLPGNFNEAGEITSTDIGGKSINITMENITIKELTDVKLFDRLKEQQPIDIDFGDDKQSIAISRFHKNLDNSETTLPISLIHLQQTTKKHGGIQLTTGSIVAICCVIVLLSLFLSFYKWPGLVFLSGLILSLLTTLSLFFTLGRGLTVDVITAFGLLASMGGLTILACMTKLKRLWQDSGLLKASINASIKYGGISMAAICVPFFIVGVLFASLSTPSLIGFGILLSLGFINLFLFAFLLPNLFLSRCPMFVDDSWFEKGYDHFKNNYSGALNRLSVGNYFWVLNILIIAIGYIVWKTIGFNSSEIADSGYVVKFLGDKYHFLSSKSASDFTESVFQTFNNSYFISRSTIEAVKTNLQGTLIPNSYHITWSNEIGETHSFLTLPILFIISLSVISLCGILKVGLMNSTKLFLNSILCGTFFLALITIGRIPITASIRFTFLFSMFWFIFTNWIYFYFSDGIIKAYNVVIVCLFSGLSCFIEGGGLIALGGFVTLWIPYFSTVLEKGMGHMGKFINLIFSKTWKPIFDDLYKEERL